MKTVSNQESVNLLGLNQKNLEEFFVSIEERPFRAIQVMKWIHQRGISDFSQMTDLSKELREVSLEMLILEWSVLYLD